MSRLRIVAAVVAAFLIVGFACHDAEARARRATRTVRMVAADADTSAAGRMRFRTRRSATFMSASFTHLAPNSMHTVRWDGVGQDGGQFVTDHRGRAKLRHMAVPDGATGDVPQVSVVDEDGNPVLTCDPDSMPAMHHPASADHHDMGEMMGGDRGMCSQECMDHCTDGGTCDAQCHEDHGCTDSCCCSGAMDGTSGDQHCGSGMQSGSSGDDSDHAAHHDGSTQGGMMGGSGSSGGGMMSGGGMHGGGMMKK